MRGLLVAAVAGVVVFGFTAHLGILAPILGVLAAGLVFYADVRRHPWMPCGRCNGKKSHMSRLVDGAYGNCWKCRGKGQFPRPAVRVLAPKVYQDMKAGRHGRSY